MDAHGVHAARPPLAAGPDSEMMAAEQTARLISAATGEADARYRRWTSHRWRWGHGTCRVERGYAWSSMRLVADLGRDDGDVFTGDQAPFGGELVDDAERGGDAPWSVEHRRHRWDVAAELYEVLVTVRDMPAVVPPDARLSRRTADPGGQQAANEDAVDRLAIVPGVCGRVDGEFLPQGHAVVIVRWRRSGFVDQLAVTLAELDTFEGHARLP